MLLHILLTVSILGPELAINKPLQLLGPERVQRAFTYWYALRAILSHRISQLYENFRGTEHLQSAISLFYAIKAVLRHRIVLACANLWVWAEGYFELGAAADQDQETTGEL